MSPLDDKHGKTQASKPANKAIHKLNPQTGLISDTATNFSSANWGEATGNYVKSINKMAAGSLEETVRMATAYMSSFKLKKLTRVPQALSEGEEDPRACLADNWYRLCLSFCHCMFLPTNCFFRCRATPPHALVKNGRPGC